MNDSPTDDTVAPNSIHYLRRHWKPNKLRLLEQQSGHPTHVRFHRACSWLQRVEEMDRDTDLDLVLTGQWIAFNALYGQWNSAAGEPLPDRECWRRFLERVLAIDSQGLMVVVLVNHKKLALAILDDAYLASFFWKDPSVQKAVQTTRDRRQASMWYVEERWGQVLEQVMERIYLQRCQLLHGAGTYNSSLNRKSMHRCTMMLEHLLVAMMKVWIDHGADENWGDMCYPPQG